VNDSRVVAVVLHYEREAHTITCVRALERSVPTSPRVLIVDNNSRDGSGERLRAQFPQHGFLQTGANLGYAGGNARGTAWAIEQGAEFVLVINDDAEVEPSTVSKLVAALERDPKAAAVGPTVLFDDAARSVCWAGGEVDLLRALGTATARAGAATIGATSSPRAVTFISGCCLMIRASALKAHGTFNADYFAYVEDVELSLRYVRAGWRLLHEPATTVLHHTAYPEPPTAAWKIRLRDKNRRRLVAEHYTGAERAKFALWFYPTRLLSMLGYALRLDGARLAAVWRGMTESLATPSAPATAQNSIAPTPTRPV
jgi:GT2 family glycosyltransferase